MAMSFSGTGLVVFKENKEVDEPPGRVARCPNLIQGGSVMRSALSAALALAFVFAMVVSAQAEEKKTKEVTLRGKITCAKCDLHIDEDCATVIVVKEKGKDVVYYFDEDANKEYHKKICKTPTFGTVKGNVSEEDGKKIITVFSVEFKKKKKE
jgi:hypothetical protein